MALALVAALAALLVALQYVTLAKFAVLPPGAGFVQWGEFWQRVPVEVPLDGGDTLLGLAVLAACGAFFGPNGASGNWSGCWPA